MKWQGRSWATLGDSITAANGYQPLVSAALGFSKVHNYGRGGCPMTGGGPTDEGATVNIGRSIQDELDCVTIFVGTNDYRLDKPIGEWGTTSPLAFTGAYRTLIEHILSHNPTCRLNLWTPLQRDKDGYDVDRPNTSGHLLDDYAEVVRRLGHSYALPVLDLYTESGLNRLTLPSFTQDGLHPNCHGHARIASMAVSFLERL